MRRTLGSPVPVRAGAASWAGSVVLSLAILSGCGSEARPAATDQPATSASPPASSSATSEPDPDEWRLIDLVSETAAGGSTSTAVTPVADPTDLAAFVGQFSSDSFAQEITDVVRGHRAPGGSVVAAAVVGIGCDVPTEVLYADGVIRAAKSATPPRQCFAPVTTVAVIEIPA